MSRSPKIKSVRCPDTDLVSRENILESSNLANDAAWWRACSVRTCDFVCVHDECSDTPYWPVGYDRPTGHGHTRAPCKMSKRLACLRGRLIACERSVAVRLAATKSPKLPGTVNNICCKICLLSLLWFPHHRSKYAALQYAPNRVLMNSYMPRSLVHLPLRRMMPKAHG